MTARGLRTVLLLLCLPVLSCGRAMEAPDLSHGGTIHVAAIQLTSVDGELGPNQANVERLVREAAARGARYILLPEYHPGQMRISRGDALDDIRARAEPLDGPIARRMVALCGELGVYVAFPLGERADDGHVYNSTVYAGPDGVEGVYRKMALIHLPQADVLQEDEIYTRGSSDGLVDWGGLRVGALICADGGFPGLYERRVAGGAQVIFHASASAGVKSGPANPMPDAAARRYHRPVVFANHWQPLPLHFGNTQIVDAEGNVLAHVGVGPNVIVDAVVTVPPRE